MVGVVWFVAEPSAGVVTVTVGPVVSMTNTLAELRPVLPAPSVWPAWAV